ncbi:DUF6783 domain-containing protein [Blautia sp. HCP3S3_H10_1]|uniref:DUF6783 domain-containing protein n=1 Tax=unclassified Blautia TaxID=2648079 RepID=UPI003F8F09A1
MFHPYSVVVARYDALIRVKSPTNCDAHLVESLFQTGSRACLKNHSRDLYALLCGLFYLHYNITAKRYNQI